MEERGKHYRRLLQSLAINVKKNIRYLSDFAGDFSIPTNPFEPESRVRVLKLKEITDSVMRQRPLSVGTAGAALLRRIAEIIRIDPPWLSHYLGQYIVYLFKPEL